MPEEPTKQLTLRQQLLQPKVLAILIPALLTASVTYYNLIKGEPKAKQTQNFSDKMAKKIDRMDILIHRLRSKIVAIQAEQSCAQRTTALLENMQLKNQLSDAARHLAVMRQNLTKKGLPIPNFGYGGVTLPPSIFCEEGSVEIKGKCKRVGKAIAKVVKDAHEDSAASKIALSTEKLRRMAAERKKASMKQLLLDKDSSKPQPLPIAPWKKK